jgi:hypothetical protein
MDARILLSGDYIDAPMLRGQKVTREITSFETKPLEDMAGKVKTRGIVSFKGTEKKWALNTTNTKCLIQMFGHETDDWVGKRVTLYPEKEPKSESGEAVRVWGSPDISEDLRFTTKIGRTKRTFHLHKVTSKNSNREPGEEG